MPKKVYLQGILLHYFSQKKYAANALRILVKTYSNYALFKTTYRNWFRCFKNSDFKIKNALVHWKSLKTKELEALLHKDSCQVQAELAESLGVDHKTVLKYLFR